MFTSSVDDAQLERNRRLFDECREIDKRCLLGDVPGFVDPSDEELDRRRWKREADDQLPATLVEIEGQLHQRIPSEEKCSYCVANAGDIHLARCPHEICPACNRAECLCVARFRDCDDRVGAIKQEFFDYCHSKGLAGHQAGGIWLMTPDLQEAKAEADRTEPLSPEDIPIGRMISVRHVI
jgi:hypothetical protein